MECLPCNSDCLACTERNFDNCTQCSVVNCYFYILYSQFSSGICINNCNDFGLLFDLTTSACLENCYVGFYNNSGYCVICPPGCSSCWGPSNSSNCYTCLNGSYYSNFGCYDSCYPLHLYGNSSDFICRPCPEYCDYCLGPKVSDCEYCLNGSILTPYTPCNNRYPPWNCTVKGLCYPFCQGGNFTWYNSGTKSNICRNTCPCG